jgi:hypothetical protein
MRKWLSSLLLFSLNYELQLQIFAKKVSCEQCKPVAAINCTLGLTFWYLPLLLSTHKKANSVALSPQANYTD